VTDTNFWTQKLVSVTYFPLIATVLYSLDWLNLIHSGLRVFSLDRVIWPC
jgi:hypothetical protein